MKYVYILLSITVIFSCRKPTDELCQDQIVDSCLGGNEQYTSSDYDYIWSELQTQAGVFGGPFFTTLGEYGYRNPVFNPNNSNEIAYIKTYNNNITPIEREIWKFNLCTGETEMIADNFYYNLDWGSNGWLLYTGTGHKIFKVKENGDSLTIISDAVGYNRAGKWNPSGSLYWGRRDDEQYIANSEGEYAYPLITSVEPFAWLNDSTLLGFGLGAQSYSYNIQNQSSTLLNDSWLCYTCPKIYNYDEMSFYVSKTNTPKAFLKYSLDGSNSVDTIRNLIESYMYIGGDYINSKIVVRLSRMHWADSTADNRYYRNNLLLMDSDGTNERLIEIPE